MNVDILWENFLDKIKENISSLSYETWFKDTKLVSLRDNVAIIIVPMPFHKKHLVENYSSIIENTFTSLTDTKFSFRFLLEEEWLEEKDNFNDKKITLPQNIPNNNIEQRVSTQSAIDANLNKDYVFSTFIVGNSNRFAYTASMAVAEKPGKAYNPLFLYGKSGLG